MLQVSNRRTGEMAREIRNSKIGRIEKCPGKRVSIGNADTSPPFASQLLCPLTAGKHATGFPSTALRASGMSAGNWRRTGLLKTRQVYEATWCKLDVSTNAGPQWTGTHPPARLQQGKQGCA